MRIKKYNKFLEDLSISPNDSPVQKMAKQSIKADGDYIKDYNAKKDALTKLFTDVGADGEFKFDDIKLKEEIEKMLGKEESGEGADRNPLLKELSIVLDLQRQITKVKKQTDQEKSRMEEAGDEAIEEEGDRKKELSKRISELKGKVTEGTNKLADLARSAEKAKSNFDKMMSEFEINLKKSTEEIAKTPKK